MVIMSPQDGIISAMGYRDEWKGSVICSRCDGFVYLVAIMDWYSRFVLSWGISTTMDTSLCPSALEQALKLSTPEIFNADQGSQFTHREFTGRLEKGDILISMDARGRVYDNIFLERLWRSVKHEEIYLHQYLTVSEARNGLAKYFIHLLYYGAAS